MKTPHLDHLKRYCPKLVKRIRLTPFEGLRISGKLADDIGALGLQELASLHGKSIIVGPNSKFHNGGGIINPRKVTK